MRIVAVTDPVAVGRGVVATIGLRVTGDTREAAARLAEIAEIEYVVVTAGSFDVIVELVCASEEELFDVLNDEIRRSRRCARSRPSCTCARRRTSSPGGSAWRGVERGAAPCAAKDGSAGA